MTDDQMEAMLKQKMAEAEVHFDQFMSRLSGKTRDQIKQEADRDIRKLYSDPDLSKRMEDAMTKVGEGIAEILQVSLEGRGYYREDNPFISLRHAISLSPGMIPNLEHHFIHRALQTLSNRLFEPWGIPSVMIPSDHDSMNILRYGRPVDYGQGRN